MPRWPHLPFPLALVLLSLAVGLAAGLDGPALLAAFGAGFGRQQGYFALVLLPSFFLAAALTRGEALGLGRLGVALSPFAGAGMVCPDTAYAALAPVTAGHRRAVAVGSYAGFKLLLPAGPLLIGVALSADVASPGFALLGLALLLPVGAAGLLWLRLAGAAEPPAPAAPPARVAPGAGLRRLLPLAFLGTLLLAGLAGRPSHPALALLTSPVGALLATSLATGALLPPEHRRECLDSSLRRTAPLLLTLGAASALGAMLAEALPLRAWASRLASGQTSLLLLLLLFAVAATFKVVNGSSMATFAAVPPVLAPVLAASSLDRTFATYAICLGSFVAILPNDSFFWLTQPSEAEGPRRGADFTFAGASLLQGLLGIALLSGALLLGGRLR
ncbi:MAG: permease [Deltaproteobacteria bacterium]|nr:permease [Deltaproteobacteria bacterium]